MSYLMNSKVAGGKRKEKHLLNLQTDEIKKELFEVIQMASILCDTSISVITLCKNNEPFLTVSAGLDASGSGTVTCDEFCKLVTYQKELLIIEDIAKDNRVPPHLSFPEHDLSLRFFGGTPLISSEGKMLGALCVMDKKSRILTENQRQGLTLLGKQVIRMVEYQRKKSKEEQFSKKIDLIQSEVLSMHSSLAINEIDDSFEKLNQKLAKQNKKLESFTNMVAHNLRSPVHNLRSLLQIHRNLKTEEEKAYIFRKFETVIDHLAQTLNELVDSLIIQQKTDKEWLSFNDIFEKIKDMISGQIIETNASITADFSQAPQILYSREYLESIMLNLLTNAIKYRSPHRELHIHLETKFINDGEVTLSVKDNGMGIDMNKHGNNLFGLSKTFHQNEEAKGVGLFITKNQVEAMNGKISAVSEVDKGTIFSISFNSKEME